MKNLAAEGRAQLYRFLRRFYAPAPDIDFVTHLFSSETIEALDALFGEEKVLPLRIWFSQQEQKADSSPLLSLLRELIADYTGLFDAPTERYLSPYESVYRQGNPDEEGFPKGWVMGPPARHLLQLYETVGVTLAPEFRDLPDHIACELEFMALLCEVEAKAEEAGLPEVADSWREWQKRFFTDHLGTWIDPLTQRMYQKALTPVYRLAATWTRLFLQQEREYLLGKPSFV